MINYLHSDIVKSIFAFLNRGELALSRLVCRRWSQLIPSYCEKDGPVMCTEYVHDRKLLYWARSQGCLWDKDTFRRAVECSPLDTIQYLLNNGCPYHKWILGYAVPRVDVLEWLISNGFTSAGNAYENAARLGDLELLEWLVNRGVKFEYSEHNDIMVTIIKSKSPNTIAMIEWYIRTWQLERKKGTYDMEDFDYLSLLDIAAEAGDVALFHYVHDHYSDGSEWSEYTCACAAEGGSLEILQYLRDNGCPWDENTCLYSAEKGHFHVTRWAIEHGCAYSHKVYSHVLKSMSLFTLDMLNWLYDRGHPLINRKELLPRACDYSYPQSIILIDWLLERGCDWNFINPIYTIDLRILQYIHSLGYVLNSELYESAETIEVCEWLFSQGVPVRDELCNQAARIKSTPLLRWARQHGCNYPQHFVYIVRTNQDLQMLRWAFADGCPINNLKHNLDFYDEAPYIKQWFRQINITFIE